MLELAPVESKLGSDILRGNAHRKHARLGLLDCLNGWVDPTLPGHWVGGHGFNTPGQPNAVVASLD